MSTVYVIGAGASHGEILSPIAGHPENRSRTPPPVLNGFFRAELARSLRYEPTQLANDFSRTFDYIANVSGLTVESAFTGAWEELNIEEIFTGVELGLEFSPADSDEGSLLRLIRNQLIRYIGRIIGLGTMDCRGDCYGKLAAALGERDSVISFNWDLLLDQELDLHDKDNQIANFRRRLFHPSAEMFHDPFDGLLLKLHGSFDWLQCTNSKCRASSELTWTRNWQTALSEAAGIHAQVRACARCGADLLPFVVPPLIRKPVAENWILRAAWGLARRRLSVATTVVVIGFSAAPTDFYAAWLLRSAVRRPGVRVFIVDPKNDPALQHVDFRRRMTEIFGEYDSRFQTFQEASEAFPL